MNSQLAWDLNRRAGEPVPLTHLDRLRHYSTYIWPWVYSLYHEPFIPYYCNHYQPGTYMYLVLYHKCMWYIHMVFADADQQRISRRSAVADVDAVEACIGYKP